MEIKNILVTEEKAKEVVMDDDFDPWDIADQLYKEWLEES